jgi:L-histidine Nalpha-methyltransferase
MLTGAAAATQGFAAAVRAGLTKAGQKELPSKYLYDEVGSKLFEVICVLPEYGLTRADERILKVHAGELVESLAGDVLVCELGSGSGKKTRWILEAFSGRQYTQYFPIEISRAALADCRREFADMKSVGVVGLESEYIAGLRKVAERRAGEQRILVLFLGSTIGNFSPPQDAEFLRQIRGALREGDALLLGTDLHKPAADLIAAYDDALGVTAAFNLNILARINRELRGEFDLSRFRHRAVWNEATRSIEMHIASLAEQRVRIAGAEWTVELEEGETIWTENSHKYALDEVDGMIAAAGYRKAGQWVDGEWAFAESLLVAA